MILSLLSPKSKWQDGDVIEVAGVSVRLVVNTRARRVILRPDRKTGEMLAVAPRVQLLPDAVDFARARAQWIQSVAARQVSTQRLRLGETVPILGVPHVLENGHPRAHHGDGRLGLRCAPDKAGTAALGYLKALAREHARDRLHHYAQALGRPFQGVRIADPLGRWGSCSSEGRIMLSWRLIMAPPKVFDYVAAHEVCHLMHLDHSPAFWRQLQALYGPTQAAQHWLRHEGQSLKAIQA